MNNELRNKRKKLIWQLPFLAFLIIGTILIISRQRSTPYQHDNGFVFGTVYSITYQSENNLKKEIEAELKKVDKSLSTFNPKSTISRINSGKSTATDSMFIEVFRIAQRISDETDGAFDITVAPLVNAWGFGFKNNNTPTPQTIDSLQHFVSYRKVKEIAGPDGRPTIKKTDSRLMLDCGAIAKGYGSDVVAGLLRNHGITNFMIEIGGEIVTSGINEKRVAWKIGVTKPTEDSLNTTNEIQTILNVTDKAMATSGNYRNFYYKNGKRFAHTIDPRTGYPVQHNILSATVLADSCTIADAYATSFMVMGLEKSQKILARNPELMAYLIYSDEHGSNAVWFSPSLKDKINK